MRWVLGRVHGLQRRALSEVQLPRGPSQMLFPMGHAGVGRYSYNFGRRNARQPSWLFIETPGNRQGETLNRQFLGFIRQRRRRDQPGGPPANERTCDGPGQQASGWQAHLNAVLAWRSRGAADVERQEGWGGPDMGGRRLPRNERDAPGLSASLGAVTYGAISMDIFFIRGLLQLCHPLKHVPPPRLQLSVSCLSIYRLVG